MTPLSAELFYTALVAAFTGLMWAPLILNRLGELGLWPALRNPNPDAQARAQWAVRLDAAHRNAIENLVVFAPLALIVDVSGAGSATTATASAVFFVTRVAHAVIYTLGVSVLRTIAFFTGFLCQMALVARLLGYL